MNRRKVAIQVIIADVAETGIAGRSAIRAYVETRMSRTTFNEACRIGQAIYQRKQEQIPGAPVGVPGVYFSRPQS